MQYAQNLFFNLHKKWIKETCILNWTALERCILVLVFFAVTSLLWAAWKSYILFHVELHQFVHMPLLSFQLKINIFLVFSSLALIALCYYLRAYAWAQTLLPILCLAKFTIFFLRDGYLVGILSPATTIGTLSFVFLGILLFERRIIYTILIPTVICISYVVYQTFIGHLPYAPLFNEQVFAQPYYNTFWMASMVYFIVPLVLICFVALELVLEQWRSREQYIQKIGQYDALTEVYNRRMINSQLLQLEKKKQGREQYVIMMIDLDHFKSINDHYGHIMGDQVLMNVAKVLRDTVRHTDIVGRYGGEEFLIIFKNIDTNAVHAIAERCRQSLYELEHRIDYTYVSYVSASIGVAFSQADMNVMQVVQAADVALYQAKAQGRNRICFAPQVQESVIPLV